MIGNAKKERKIHFIETHREWVTIVQDYIDYWKGTTWIKKVAVNII